MQVPYIMVPTNYGTTLAWLRADKGVNIVNKYYVQSWDDVRGTPSASYPSLNYYPTFVRTGKSRLAGVRFSGSTLRVTIPSSTHNVTSGFTLFGVFSNAFGNADSAYSPVLLVGTSFSRTGLIINVETTRIIRAGVDGTTFITTSLTSDQNLIPFVMTVDSTANSSQRKFFGSNGYEVTSGPLSTMLTSDCNLNLGGRNANEASTAVIHEAGLLSSVLTPTEATDMVNLLTTQYASYRP